MSPSLQVTQVVWGPHPEDDLEPPDFTKASCRPPSAATNAPTASSRPPLRLRAYPSRLALVVSGEFPRPCGAGCRVPQPTTTGSSFVSHQCRQDQRIPITKSL